MYIKFDLRRSFKTVNFNRNARIEGFYAVYLRQYRILHDRKCCENRPAH